MESGRSGCSGLAKLFCHTIWPLEASSAVRRSSMLRLNTRSLTPPDVVTPPTTIGAVRVERISAREAVVSRVLHSGFSLPTLAFDSAVSPRFHPVRWAS
jgi:hypothetical protein